ncbi:MAG: TonB-dependent receptor, partial [Candidatus Symbiothrix sp.]|nr:TonB-dependent receptor [Candidatus Symbiothrix sp.]
MREKKFDIRRAFRFRRFAHKSYAAFNSMHKVVSIGVVVGSMLTFSPVTETAAQSLSASVRDSIPDKELDEVIVSASKAELTLNQTAKLVTIITCNEIERQPVASVQDLLKNVVGLDVRQRGSNGVLSGISVRGGTFEQTAILLNGVNLSNPQTAHYSLDLPVNLSDIERIEIIQGPNSLIYGAGAFSGGINIITKKKSGTGIYLNTEGGMHKLYGAEARGSLQGKSSSHSLSAGYKAADGYIDNSDFKTLNALWQSNFYVDDSKLDFQLGINDKAYGANTFYSPAYPAQFDDTRSIFASIRGESGTKLKFMPQLYWNRHYDTFHLFREGTPDIPAWYTDPNYHRTDVFGFNLNVQYKWRAGITNIGGELRNEGIYSSVLGKILSVPDGKYTYSDNRTNNAYFIEHNFLFKQFTLGLGLLANYNTAFTDDFGFYPSINASWRATDDLKVFASWNNSTRVPTFTDLYYKGATHKGNSDVQPEKSEAFELGAKYSNIFIAASVNGFYMKGKNLIDWVKEKSEDLWESRNLTDLDKTGFETQFSFRLQELIPQFSGAKLDIGYRFMHQSKNVEENLISNYVMDYLKHKLTIGLSHPIYRGLSADWQFRWQDRGGTYTQYINLKPAEEVAYPAFSLLDVKLNQRINNFNIYLKVNNLF